MRFLQKTKSRSVGCGRLNFLQKCSDRDDTEKGVYIVFHRQFINMDLLGVVDMYSWIFMIVFSLTGMFNYLIGFWDTLMTSNSLFVSLSLSLSLSLSQQYRIKGKSKRWKLCKRKVMQPQYKLSKSRVLFYSFLHAGLFFYMCAKLDFKNKYIMEICNNNSKMKPYSNSCWFHYSNIIDSYRSIKRSL